MHQSDVDLADSRKITITRSFDAPRALVFRMWTEPAQLRRWWGLRDSTIVHCEVDLRVGGTFRIDMRTSEGITYVNRGVYLEVVADEQIAYEDLRDADVRARIPTGRHTIRFADGKNATIVTLTSEFDTPPDRTLMVNSGMIGGIQQSLERLADILAASTLI
ncbi:MAG: SRPBCC domain-containing protein [Candidatus Eremiobacteraeota bacterium]|nr:SRPBCC domain-containing protein [Candidatus Eremiobacteraeota bacterium]